MSEATSLPSILGEMVLLLPSKMTLTYKAWGDPK